MDAIILAAGLGTRLRPHTLSTPKPLLPVRGRPILDWILAALPSSVSRLVVVTHYLREQVDDYLKRQHRFADWETVFQATPRGTGDALMSCRDVVKSEKFFVLNGDDLYAGSDLAALAGYPQGLLVHPVDEPRRFGITYLRADGTLDRLVEKPDISGRQLANIGAYLFPRTVLDLQLPLSPRGEYEITDAVSQLAAQGQFHAVEATTWLPIGNEEQWQRANQLDLDAVLK